MRTHRDTTGFSDYNEFIEHYGTWKQMTEEEEEVGERKGESKNSERI